MSDTLVLTYNLFDLPTAQHKAGLAGLLIMIESMKRREIGPLPVIQEKSDYSAKISFTKESMQAVFDDLFDAEWIEVKVGNKWQGKKPKRIEETVVVRDGKNKKEKRFIYDAFQPKGLFLQTFYPDDNGAWIQIWRDMLWNVLRAQPQTRRVYEERAKNKQSSLSKKAFDSISSTLGKSSKGKFIPEGFAGSVYIGAQNVNAEKVSFSGDPINNFLLHFWHIASFIYMPLSFSLKRSIEKGISVKWENYGYVLAIPEPSDLEGFIEDTLDILEGLRTDTVGKRPKDAIIDLMEEGGLEYLYQFSKCKFENSAATDSINAVDLYHIEKRGNNVRMLSSERLIADSAVLKEYERMRRTIFNPLFKKIYLRNLLLNNRWYDCSDDVVGVYPCELFSYRTGRSPVRFPFFGRDVKKKFRAIIEDLKRMGGGEKMKEENRDNQLSVRIYDLIKQYVRMKAQSKSGLDFRRFEKDNKGRTIYPKQYREALEKVCSDAFLSMRGRRDQDFVEYFTGTICSVPQYCSKDDFILVSQLLIDHWERVKTLSMLAISAHSYLPLPQPEKQEGE